MLSESVVRDALNVPNGMLTPEHTDETMVFVDISQVAESVLSYLNHHHCHNSGAFTPVMTPTTSAA
jgi:hypothetical protein